MDRPEPGHSKTALIGVRQLVVIDKIGFPNDVVHGVGTYLLQTLPTLAQFGLTTRVLVLGPTHRTVDDLRQRGVEITCLNQSKWSIRSPLVVKRELASWRPDLVHVHGTKSIATSLLWGSRHGPPIVAHIHDNVTSPIDPLIARALRCASAILTPSAALRASLEKRLPGVGPIGVIPYGYDLAPFAAGERARTRRDLGFTSEHIVIGCPGRLAEAKGQQDLIEALATLKRGSSPSFTNLRAVFIGDGDYRAALTELAQGHELLETVEFLGNRGDMPDVLAACDLVVIPSRWFEAFGLVALEAMASGKYVIASETGGLADLVRDTGTLHPPGDVPALAKAIEDFAGAPDSYQARIRKGLERSREYELARHNERLLDVYGRVLARRHGEMPPTAVTVG